MGEVFRQDDMAEVGEEAFAEFEQGDAFGAFLEGEGFVAVGQADGAEENRVGFFAQLAGFGRECGFVAFVEGGPADVGIGGGCVVWWDWAATWLRRDLHGGGDDFRHRCRHGEDGGLRFIVAPCKSERE